MGVFLGIAGGFCVAFLSLKLGWPWPAFLVPGYLVTLAIITPRIAAGKPGAAATARTLWAVAVFGFVDLFTTWFLFEALRSIDGTGTGFLSRVYAFAFATDELKLFWAITGGIIFAYSVTTLVMRALPVGANSSTSRSGQPLLSLGGSRRERASNQGRLIVDAGKVTAGPGTSPDVATSGAAEQLIVTEGHAVILKRDGRMTRVVGGGVQPLQPGERLSAVVILYPRQEKIELHQVATKDRVLLQDVNFLVFHRLDPGEEDRRIYDGPFTFTEERVIKAASNGGDWRGAIISISHNVGRDVFGRHNLDELLPLSDTKRQAIRDELKDVINATTVKLGVVVHTVDIGAIRVPTEIEQRLQDEWMALSEQRAARIRGETEQELEAGRRVHRLVTVGGVTRQLLDDLSKSDQITPRDLIALRFIEYLEQRMDGKDDGVLDDINSLVKLQSLETLKTLRER